MKTKTSILAIICFFLLPLVPWAQENKSIDIQYLNSKFTDTLKGKSVMASFLVTTPNQESFPPVINFPVKCTVFEGGREKVVLLHQHNLVIALDNEQIVSRNPEVYAMIKDQINLMALKNAAIVTYKIKDLNYVFTKMSLTPAFNVKNKREEKVEKRFEFDVK